MGLLRWLLRGVKRATLAAEQEPQAKGSSAHRRSRGQPGKGAGESPQGAIETVTKAAEASHLHKRVDTEEFARVDIEIEPLPCGSGVVYLDDTRGAAIPSKYLAAVEEGIRQAMESGVVSDHPVSDVSVTVSGGLSGIGSSNAAFKTAAREALFEALRRAGPRVVVDSPTAWSREFLVSRSRTKRDLIEEQRRLRNSIPSLPDSERRKATLALEVVDLELQIAELKGTETKEDLEALADYSHEVAEYLKHEPRTAPNPPKAQPAPEPGEPRKPLNQRQVLGRSKESSPVMDIDVAAVRRWPTEALTRVLAKTVLSGFSQHPGAFRRHVDEMTRDGEYRLKFEGSFRFERGKEFSLVELGFASSSLGKASAHGISPGDYAFSLVTGLVYALAQKGARLDRMEDSSGRVALVLPESFDGLRGTRHGGVAVVVWGVGFLMHFEIAESLAETDFEKPSVLAPERPRTGRLDRERTTTASAKQLPGGHAVIDGCCRHCGCSEQALSQFGWDCSGSARRPVQEARASQTVVNMARVSRPGTVFFVSSQEGVRLTTIAHEGYQLRAQGPTDEVMLTLDDFRDAPAVIKEGEPTT